MTSSLTRARLLGVLVLVVVFGLGAGLGYSLPKRDDGEASIKVMVKQTDRIPKEIEALGLTEEQRGLVQAALRRGSGRVRGVMMQFEPHMSAVIDSTESEIRAILTEAQRAGLDEARRKNPTRVFREERIDTIRR